MSEIFDRALAAHRRGDYETALRDYAAVHPLKHARQNLGSMLREIGRLDEAERVLRSVLDAYPDDAPGRYSLAMTLLAQERYAEGWPLHEARRNPPLNVAPNPEGDAPEWLGEDLNGRRIVVCAEQGYGDQMMFARYLPWLQAQGAEVVVGCNALMRPLFAGLGFAVAPYSPMNARLPACDAWILMGSLPLRLGSQPPPPPLALAPRGSGGGIGVVPAGNPQHQFDRYRSLDGRQAERLSAFGRDLRPEATGARDFKESAELYAGLDLVITVDTSSAHLAASIGVPTWILIPDAGADWRWQRERLDSPWYPSARLFRQPKRGDWDSVLDEVEAALR